MTTAEGSISTVLILGGAGFIGSRIARACVKSGHKVTVIDGLLPRTFGNRGNLDEILAEIHFHACRVEDEPALDSLLAASEVIVDAMGWTCHRLALNAPLYDMELNVGSHAAWLGRTPPGKRVIYLGSRGQYGDPAVDRIDENTPMVPADVQGVHKLAAEQLLRVYSRLRGFGAISLRIPNCVGPHQPVEGEDIGLVGGFLRDLLMDRPVRLYGSNRRRQIAFVDDVAAITERLVRKEFEGFDAFNVFCHEAGLVELVESLIRRTGRGSYTVEPFPHEVKTIDIGVGILDSGKLASYLGGEILTPLDTILDLTVKEFRRRLS